VSLRGPLLWTLGEVTELVQETPRVGTLHLQVPEWPGHLAGQHVDVRLTAEDGYQAQRSYSIASPPEDSRLAITVERLEDGEVSPYLVGELKVGDKLELRGPIGDRALVKYIAPTRLLYSSRTFEDVIYRAELDRLAAAGDGLSVAQTLTRAQPAGWKGYARRIDREMVREVAWPSQQAPLVFVCGPTSFVETAAGLLVDSGYDPSWIKTERFGATGG
jgi:ferredoxin-NADP reductase